MRRLLAFLMVAGCFWGLQAWSLGHLSTLRTEENFPLMVPDPRIAAATVTDFDNVAADMLWLAILQRNGEQIVKADESRRDFTGLHEALELLTDLDPRFHEAALFGSWVLSDAGEPAKARELLLKGMERFPERWDYPFQLGFVDFLYLRNYQEAGDYFMKASNLPGAPVVSLRMAAGMYAKGNKTDLAIATWRDIYEHGNASVRGIAKRRLAKLGIQID